MPKEGWTGNNKILVDTLTAEEKGSRLSVGETGQLQKHEEGQAFSIEASAEYMKRDPGQLRALLRTLFVEGETTEHDIKEFLKGEGYQDEILGFETVVKTRHGKDGEGKFVEEKVTENHFHIKSSKFREGGNQDNENYIYV